MSNDPSDARAQEVLKEFIQRTYSDLATLAWHLGADGDVFQRDAVPASELVDEAYFEINREKEFEAPVRQQPYSTLNHRQQFGERAFGASL
nr:hypothetical protein [Sinorhizobium fredii]